MKRKLFIFTFFLAAALFAEEEVKPITPLSALCRGKDPEITVHLKYVKLNSEFHRYLSWAPVAPDNAWGVSSAFTEKEIETAIKKEKITVTKIEAATVLDDSLHPLVLQKFKIRAKSLPVPSKNALIWLSTQRVGLENQATAEVDISPDRPWVLLKRPAPQRELASVVPEESLEAREDAIAISAKIFFYDCCVPEQAIRKSE